MVLVCNLKPANMRGIQSQAMVLAATSPDGSRVSCRAGCAVTVVACGMLCWETEPGHAADGYTCRPGRRVSLWLHVCICCACCLHVLCMLCMQPPSQPTPAFDCNCKCRPWMPLKPVDACLPAAHQLPWVWELP